jgi:uncharacterized membrane protein
MSDSQHRPDRQSPKPWFYRRAVIDSIFWGLVGLCAVLGLADLVYHRHTLFSFEFFPGIYGIFGFISCVFIVFAGIGLRKLVMRDEDYYDR